MSTLLKIIKLGISRKGLSNHIAIKSNKNRLAPPKTHHEGDCLGDEDLFMWI